MSRAGGASLASYHPWCAFRSASMPHPQPLHAMPRWHSVGPMASTCAPATRNHGAFLPWMAASLATLAEIPSGPAECPELADGTFPAENADLRAADRRRVRARQALHPGRCNPGIASADFAAGDALVVA